MKRITLAMIATLALTGCHTIHFDYQEPVVSNAAKSTDEWHHNVALALVEVSKPVDLAQNCGANGWASVKTETTFLNGLPVAVIPYLGLIWTPKTATVQCQ
ncbi:lipoprotein [Ferrimonas balearica DSM 9799]|uniref:Lipoprotein n=1 Tax=Ferrimonas balearica (strain DSM 9799 / CCM 4581 / KCTC 23876 / PAT) TaxID=550540 RepID=E1SLX4_FERBD|nr:Bor family protein [Ferrimonas balearica]ADN75506.1 lipoprotein [Ferrimonas balearica DSM 9799]MBY5979160.1 Bor family protein [Ferrimonas balearica]